MVRLKAVSGFYREQDPFFGYAKTEVADIVSVDGNPAYVVKGYIGNSDPDVMYFDVKSGLLVRIDSVIPSPEGKTNTIMMISDYRTVDGVKIAFRIVTKMPQFDLVITGDEVKHNVEIDNKFFTPPVRPNVKK